MSESTTYTVTGMTCGHCVASVSEEIGELAGVEVEKFGASTGRLEL